MASSSSQSCAACHRPLKLQIESENDDEGMEGAEPENVQEVDDDLQVQCGCHFHWQCMLDNYTVTECPNCNKDITTISEDGQQRILCNLKNEGGIQHGLDILPLLTEETYLKAYPEERKCQAFLEFCGAGDVEAIVELLEDDEEEDEDERDVEASSDILRYQDTIRTMNSGLHVAIQNQKPEIAWLLLLLASTLDSAEFPPEVKSAAETFGLRRQPQDGKTDIRALQDSEGKTAEERAVALGGIWEDWVTRGRLRPPA